MKASANGFLKGALLVSLLTFSGFAISGTFNAADSAQAAKPKAAEEKAAAPAKKSDKGASEPAKIDPSDPTSIIYLDTSGKPAGLGDPNKPPSVSYKLGQGWHPQALSASGLARDRYGLIDWAKLVREKVIKPKPALDPNEEEMPPLKMDVLIPAKGDFVDDVIYPHEMHTYWLKCEVCHPQIFIPAKGENNMTMVGITQGQWCGRCHGKVAFPLTDCKRCHSAPKKAASK